VLEIGRQARPDLRRPHAPRSCCAHRSVSAELLLAGRRGAAIGRREVAAWSRRRRRARWPSVSSIAGRGRRTAPARPRARPRRATRGSRTGWYASTATASRRRPNAASAP
jgi:hypothetical protein